MTENYELKVAEKTETHLVGIKNKDNEVIAACMLTAVPVMKIFKYFYSNRGPVIDYENKELVHFFFNELSKYLKQQRCLYVRIDHICLINIVIMMVILQGMLGMIGSLIK